MFESDKDIVKCEWCGEEYELRDLIATDVGSICEHCLQAIISRGEPITVYYD